ncbi:hypothetical protein [Olivibacter jilunii]|uniref:hypothetical protein n=1 Tax=Olivibacter jilunii TaxID=985016 RepID=UPI003F1585F7
MERSNSHIHEEIGSVLELNYVYTVLTPIVFPYRKMYCCYYGISDTIFGFGNTIEESIHSWHLELCVRMSDLNEDDVLGQEIKSKLLGEMW